MNKLTPLIPKTYIRIACSEIANSKVEVFYSRERQNFMIVIDEIKTFGPISIGQIHALHHALADVIGFRGRYGAV